MYDVVIIGSGPAGLAAAIYSGRYDHKTLLIKGLESGGAAANAWTVENYPGYISINGADLTSKMEEQAKGVGAEISNGEVKQINKESGIFSVVTERETYKAKTIIYAAGTRRRELGLPNEAALCGKGVSYCATCDGPLFRNKVVGIVGGGDSSVKAAVIMHQYVKKLYLITINDMLAAEPINLDLLEKTDTTIIYDTKVNELLEEEGRLAGIRISKPYENSDKITLDGLFVEIGGVPNADILKPLGVKMDEKKHIIVDWLMHTNIEGIFAAGDVTNAFDGFKQIITAAATGSAAAYGAHNYLNNHS